MPVVEKSEKAWYVYRFLSANSTYKDCFSDKDLEALYDAASSMSLATNWPLASSLKAILGAIQTYGLRQE